VFLGAKSAESQIDIINAVWYEYQPWTEDSFIELFVRFAIPADLHDRRRN
jgi:hypothetical protein